MSEPNFKAIHPRVDWSHGLTKRPKRSSLKPLLGWIKKIRTGCFTEIIGKPYHRCSGCVPFQEFSCSTNKNNGQNYQRWHPQSMNWFPGGACLVRFRRTQLNMSIWFIWCERCQSNSGVDRRTGLRPHQQEVQEIYTNWKKTQQNQPHVWLCSHWVAWSTTRNNRDVTCLTKHFWSDHFVKQQNI